MSNQGVQSHRQVPQSEDLDEILAGSAMAPELVMLYHLLKDAVDTLALLRSNELWINDPAEMNRPEALLTDRELMARERLKKRHSLMNTFHAERRLWPEGLDKLLHLIWVNGGQNLDVGYVLRRVKQLSDKGLASRKYHGMPDLKPAKKPAPGNKGGKYGKRYDWSQVDWSKSYSQIARDMGCTLAEVCQYAKRWRKGKVA